VLAGIESIIGQEIRPIVIKMKTSFNQCLLATVAREQQFKPSITLKPSFSELWDCFPWFWLVPVTDLGALGVMPST
jgi:hypothetical protein